MSLGAVICHNRRMRGGRGVRCDKGFFFEGGFWCYDLALRVRVKRPAWAMLRVNRDNEMNPILAPVVLCSTVLRVGRQVSSQLQNVIERLHLKSLGAYRILGPASLACVARGCIKEEHSNSYPAPYEYDTHLLVNCWRNFRLSSKMKGP